MRYLFSLLRRPAPVWLVAVMAITFGLAAGAAYPSYTATLFAVNNAANVVPLTVTGFSGQTSHLQDWKNSGGSVLSSIDAAGNAVHQAITGTTITGSTFVSSAFTASTALCTNASKQLIAAGNCGINTLSYDNGGSPITVKTSGSCAANTICACQTSPSGGEAHCDSDNYYNLNPWIQCSAILAYAGPAATAFGVIAFVGNNTNTGAGNEGDHLLFFNGTGTAIGAGTDLSAYVNCQTQQ